MSGEERQQPWEGESLASLSTHLISQEVRSAEGLPQVCQFTSFQHGQQTVSESYLMCLAWERIPTHPIQMISQKSWGTDWKGEFLGGPDSTQVPYRPTTIPDRKAF